MWPCEILLQIFDFPVKSVGDDDSAKFSGNDDSRESCGDSAESGGDADSAKSGSDDDAAESGSDSAESGGDSAESGDRDDSAESGGDDLWVVERFVGESAVCGARNLRPVKERVLHHRPPQGAGVHGLLLTAVHPTET